MKEQIFTQPIQITDLLTAVADGTEKVILRGDAVQSLFDALGGLWNRVDGAWLEVKPCDAEEIVATRSELQLGDRLGRAAGWNFDYVPAIPKVVV